MTKKFFSEKKLSWRKKLSKYHHYHFDLETTARCNLNCRHCYINLPCYDPDARKKELSFDEVCRIANEAVSLGAISCLITGGEPLLKKDFFDIFLFLKKKGLLVSVFTNATMIQKRHVNFFKKNPPGALEVTVYGSTQATYERITRVPGSFRLFMRGLNLLFENGIRVRFKAVALRSNLHEMPAIAEFCRKFTKDYFRFDPFLHLRYDRNTRRNQEIIKERLSVEEIVALEEQDPERSAALGGLCNDFMKPDRAGNRHTALFDCTAGYRSFAISSDGIFHPCAALRHPAYAYDLKKGTLSEALLDFTPRVMSVHSRKKDFLRRCRKCTIYNLCMWCPAYAHLETGELDVVVDYFCRLAHARERMLKKIVGKRKDLSRKFSHYFSSE